MAGSTGRVAVTFPYGEGRFDLESSGWISVLSGSVQTARVSSAVAMVFIMNSVGGKYPSVQCGCFVL